VKRFVTFVCIFTFQNDHLLSVFSKALSYEDNGVCCTKSNKERSMCKVSVLPCHCSPSLSLGHVSSWCSSVFQFVHLLSAWVIVLCVVCLVQSGVRVSSVLDHFARCKSLFQFLTLHKSWDRIQATDQKVKQTSLRCFLYMWNKENGYKLKQEVFLDQCLHLAKWSVICPHRDDLFMFSSTSHLACLM